MFEKLHEVDTEFFEVSVFAIETVFEVFDDGKFVFLQEPESFGRRKAAMSGIQLNESIEEDGYLVVFDEMLEILITTVLADKSFTRQILL